MIQDKKLPVLQPHKAHTLTTFKLLNKLKLILYETGSQPGRPPGVTQKCRQIVQSKGVGVKLLL